MEMARVVVDVTYCSCGGEGKVIPVPIIVADAVAGGALGEEGRKGKVGFEAKRF